MANPKRSDTGATFGQPCYPQSRLDASAYQRRCRNNRRENIDQQLHSMERRHALKKSSTLYHLHTRLTFSPGQPELEGNKPFATPIAPFHSYEEGSPNVGIDPRFALDENDIVPRNTRWVATTANNLEQILKAQHIDTLVIICEPAYLALLPVALTLACS